MLIKTLPEMVGSFILDPYEAGVVPCFLYFRRVVWIIQGYLRGRDCFIVLPSLVFINKQPTYVIRGIPQAACNGL